MPLRSFKIPTKIGYTGYQDVQGGNLAKLQSVLAAANSQDPIVSHGRRILACAGIQGSENFSVPNGSNPASLTQIYPEDDHTQNRLVTRVRLMPGMRPSVVALALPSGPSQYEMDLNAWRPNGRLGALKVACNWDNGTDDYTAFNIYPVKSSDVEPYGGEPNAFSYSGVVKIKADLNIPPEVLHNPAFNGEVTATLTIAAEGSLRLIDCAVYETPFEYVRDDDYREGPQHLATAKYPSEYSITGLSLDNDARFGPRQFLKASRDQRLYWGPTLFQWTSHDESTGSVTATEPSPVTTTTTSLVNLTFTSLTSWASTRPGFSISSGTGRPAEWNGILELRERNGVLPVTVRAYMKVSSGTGTIRFQSEDYSLTELTTTSTSYSWVEGLAWLRCGLHQNVPSSLQVLGKVASGGQTLSVLYLAVDYGGHYELQD